LEGQDATTYIGGTLKKIGIHKSFDTLTMNFGIHLVKAKCGLKKEKMTYVFL